MVDLLAILAVFLSFAPCMALAHAFLRLPPLPGSNWRAPLDTGPEEPCWTEEIVSDGRYLYARSHCPHDLLMELDERARRGDYPVPNVDG